MATPALHTCAAAPLDLGEGAPLPTQIELLPVGPFNLIDRTGQQVTQSGQVTDANALIARSLEMATGGAFPIDFDHGLDDGGTKDGRAAGWIMGLSVQGDRIVGEVEWSTDGAAALTGKMYRYVSPTFYTDEATGRGALHRPRWPDEHARLANAQTACCAVRCATAETGRTKCASGSIPEGDGAGLGIGC